jgi:hypothetical protein
MSNKKELKEKMKKKGTSISKLSKIFLRDLTYQNHKF